MVLRRYRWDSGLLRSLISAAIRNTSCLPERDLVPIPDGVNDAEAVSLVLNYLTAYQMLHRIAYIDESERILVHGAAGGVGTALLQLGKLAGLEMYGTASRTEAFTGARTWRDAD